MEVISFDLFDTLLTRDVYKPTDLFYFIGKKVSKELELEIDPKFFQAKRVESERIARIAAKKGGKEEVSIRDIYDSLIKILGLNSEVASRIMDIEIKMETDSVTLIAENFKKLNKNSIIISDSYLDKKTLVNILKKFEIDNYLDVFVSSEIGKTKSSGNLYRYIQDIYKIRKHLGDNKVSDFKVPRKLGLQAEEYKNSRASRYEKTVYSLDVDYELKSVLAGAMKSARLYLYYDNEHLQTIHTISTNVIGPFLFSYVYWVLYNAQKLGLEKLFFLSRDGQILHEIAQKISKNFEMFKNIKMNYIYVSRKTLYLPAIVSKEDIDLIPKILDLRDFENDFGISPSQNVLKIAEDERGKLLGYLSQEGFDKDSKIGIVDVGWRGRLQFCISKILDSTGIYNGITGFYVGLIKPVPFYGKDVRYTFFDPHFHYQILSAPLIETFCSATHGLTVGYEYRDGKINPIFKEKENSEMLKWGLEIQQNSIKLFCDFFINNIIKYDANIKLEDLKKISEVVLDIFINNPTKAEAQTYGSVLHYPDVIEKVRYNMAERLKFADLIRVLISRRFYTYKKILWREGSIVLSIPYPISKAFLMLLYLRKILEKVILSRKF